jgi:lysozyme
MKLSKRGAALIAEFEGFRSAPYRDAVGVWTIGYGSTRGVGPNTPPVTREQALARMMREIDETYGAAVNALGVPLNQNQFDALVSFVYNVGPGGISPTTTVGKRLRARDMRGAADALLAWNKAGGRVLPGLTRRRHAERALFLEPVTPTGPAAWLTPVELRRVRELDAIRAGARPAHPNREAVLVRLLTLARKNIWRAAQPKTRGGDGRGWDYAHRRKRYNSLLARTT